MDRILPFLACLVILNGCGSRDVESESSDLAEIVPTYELSLDREKSISISIIDTIGSAYGDSTMFGSINDIDIYGNRFYLLDRKLAALSVFDIKSNALIARIKLPRGHGPGEMNDPFQFCMDSEGYSYIGDGNHYVHIFDDEFNFKTRFPHLSTMLHLHASSTEVFIVPIFYFKTDKPAVEVIDQRGNVVGSFGHQHGDFEENWVNNQLQGTTYISLASDSKFIYLVPALPLLIQTFTHGTHIQEGSYTFTSKYVGGQVESPDGRWMYPTGLITGMCSFNENQLIVFTRDMESSITYLNLIDIQGQTYIECNLTEQLGELRRFPISASDGERLYIEQRNPFPHVIVLGVGIQTH